MVFRRPRKRILDKKCTTYETASVYVNEVGKYAFILKASSIINEMQEHKTSVYWSKLITAVRHPFTFH